MSNRLKNLDLPGKNNYKGYLMSIDLKNLGTMFRQKREEMHLTLKEIENATSIRMIYLQALEEGDVEKYLSTVYALGFFKQYASFLGYDPEKIIKDNPQAFNLAPLSPEFEYGIGTLDIRNHKANYSKWKTNLKWFGLAFASGFVFWLIMKAFGWV
jgi:cytoskeletal protein RodZ